METSPTSSPSQTPPKSSSLEAAVITTSRCENWPDGEAAEVREEELSKVLRVFGTVLTKSVYQNKIHNLL